MSDDAPQATGCQCGGDYDLRDCERPDCERNKSTILDPWLERLDEAALNSLCDAEPDGIHHEEFVGGPVWRCVSCGARLVRHDD
jgi:hypothetical protein